MVYQNDSNLDRHCARTSGRDCYIARDSAFYAKRMVDRLTNRSIQIAGFPFSGREVPEYRLKQIRQIIEGSYRIIYYIKSDGIDVLAVLHCAQDCLKDSDE